MFLLFGIFCSSFLNGGAIGMLSKRNAHHSNQNISYSTFTDALNASNLVRYASHVAAFSTLTSISLIISKPAKLTYAVGITGFMFGNLLHFRDLEET